MHQVFCNASYYVRRMFCILFTTSAVLTVVGCEPPQQIAMSTPEPHPLRLALADKSFRLSDADRAKLLPGFDVQALERLLGMIRPDMRQEILKSFQQREQGQRLGHLMGFEDPELQTVLEEVWAPMWDYVGASDAQIEANDYGYPGREIAKQRRAARAASQRGGSE